MRHLRIGPGRQRGTVAIVVALSIAMLIGFVGLALDLGKLYVAKSELQNSADACALAAAQELKGANSPLDALVIAEADGMAAGTRNKVLFQSEAASYSANANVAFSQILAGPYASKAGLSLTEIQSMKYVRCTVTRAGIANWFMQVLGIGSQTVQAQAVASLATAQTTCALPVAVCNSKLSTLKTGDWIAGALDPKAANKGSFRWVDTGTQGGGAKEISDIFTGSGVCNYSTTQTVTLKPGNNNGVDTAWNTRFGIYKGSYSITNAVPDFTGFGYTPKSWPTVSNAYTDFIGKQNSFTPYQGDNLTGLDTNTPNATNTDHTLGADRRVSIVPVVDCAKFDAGSAPVLSWACMLMLHPIGPQPKKDPVFSIPGEDPVTGVKLYLEYLGSASTVGSPCITNGIPGDTNATGPKVPALVQ